MFLEELRKEENLTYTENGALTNRSTDSYCLDLFATIGALRNAEDNEIISRFIKAYTEDRNMAMKILFFARDIRGGLGERRAFRSILKWLSLHEADSVRKNITNVPEYGRFDDLLSLLDGPCEKDMLSFIKEQLEKDLSALKTGESVSLLAKWLPSVNTSNKDSVKSAKKLAKAMGFSDAEYRKVLVSLRAEIKLMENYLREKDYSFSYEKQPSKALYKYRLAFLRNDRERYSAFLDKAEKNPSVMNTGTLTPYDVAASIIHKEMAKEEITEEERRSLDVTWKALPDYTGAENALVIVDISASMFYNWGSEYMPAAVAQSLGIYFAEHNKGCFHNHFISFSENPRLVEVEGRDIVDKIRYCMSLNEYANTDLQKVFDLLLKTALKNHAKQEEIPEKLYIISDMEFDGCVENAEITNFECAKKKFAKYGYKLPQIVFWNVNSRNQQQPVTKNEQGVALVSGASPQIFSMLSEGILDPYSFMLETLSAKRYERICAYREENMFKIEGKVNTAVCFASVVENCAIQQIKRMCDYDFTAGSQIRIMPDVHAGKGCTIGTTMTVHDKVVPNIVGVDIGCGMYTINLGKAEMDFEKLDKATHFIPSGMSVWDREREEFDLEAFHCYGQLKNPNRLRKSLGTLGGGNHFIEVDISKDGTKYLVIHSGSRNLGKQVAELYQKIAIEQHKGVTDIPEDLCYLYGETLQDYLHDVELCQHFARRNREIMAKIIFEKCNLCGTDAFHTVHNYIDSGEMILRKGAIAAHAGERVLIPINMRDGSILALGKGNPEWNYSAPHGAGRVMSRTKAQNELSMEEYRESMKGIYSSSINQATLDEAPMAYKSLEDIINVLEDTVDIIEVLKPIYNFKASE